MKNLSTILNKLWVLLLIPFFLTSCGEDEQNIIPTINVISDQFDASLNFNGASEEKISFTIDVNAPNGLTDVTATVYIDNVADETLYSETISPDNSITEFTSPSIDFNLANKHVDKSVRILIEVIDSKFNEVSESLNITAKGKYEQGVFILNEGNFGSANSSVAHFNLVTETAEGNIFNKTTSTTLGDVAQSLYVSNDKAYVVVNNSNKVEVVNANTFELDFTIEAALPRYFTISGDKGYLTEWVSFTDPGRVSVINLSTGASETTITTGSGAENIIEANGNLYVSNNFQSDVSVIDPSTNSVVTTIDVRKSPGGFAVDANGTLWVICGGDFGGNNGAFYKINTSDNNVSGKIELEKNVPVKIAMNNAKNAIYYFSGNEVFKVNITDSEKPSSTFITEASAVSFYGIGVNPSNDNIYLGDSKGFQADGVVFRYTSDGTAIDSFNVGVGPNGFAFK